MQKMCRKYLNRWKPNGLTLVEVLAGSALLGTVLVLILITSGRLNTHSVRAANYTKAYRVADGLLEQWWPEKEAFPRNDSGDVPDHEYWRWQTSIVSNDEAQELGAEVVALEIIDSQNPLEPLAHIEIMLPVENDEEQSTDIN